MLHLNNPIDEEQDTGVEVKKYLCAVNLTTIIHFRRAISKITKLNPFAVALFAKVKFETLMKNHISNISYAFILIQKYEMMLQRENV